MSAPSAGDPRFFETAPRRWPEEACLCCEARAIVQLTMEVAMCTDCGTTYSTALLDPSKTRVRVPKFAWRHYLEGRGKIPEGEERS